MLLSNPSFKRLHNKTMTDETVSALQILRNLDPFALHELTKFEKSLCDERIKFFEKLNISEVQNKLVNLKGQIKEDYTMQLRDENYYRLNMFQLESRISQAKEQFSKELCELIKLEIDLSQELQIMSKRLEEWNRLPEDTQNVQKYISAENLGLSTDKHDDPNRVLIKFLANSGGPTGGWQEQDHLLFLRERRKFRGKPKFISSVNLHLPDITIGEIEAHEDWYKQYEELKFNQKQAIKKWKSEKLSSKFEQEKTDNDLVEPKPRFFRSLQEKRDITERIKEWKRQQQLKKDKEEERLRNERKQMHEERIRKKKADQAKRMAVEEFRTEKLNKIKQSEIKEQMEQLRAIEEKAKKNVLLKIFREQDLEYLDKKRLAKVAAEIKERQRLARLQHVARQVAVQAGRDPQRLLQPTQVWTQRCLQVQQSTNDGQIIDLQNIPKLAVPNWRKGLQNV